MKNRFLNALFLMCVFCGQIGAYNTTVRIGVGAGIRGQVGKAKAKGKFWNNNTWEKLDQFYQTPEAKDATYNTIYTLDSDGHVVEPDKPEEGDEGSTPEASHMSKTPVVNQLKDIQPVGSGTATFGNLLGDPEPAQAARDARAAAMANPDNPALQAAARAAEANLARSRMDRNGVSYDNPDNMARTVNTLIALGIPLGTRDPAGIRKFLQRLSALEFNNSTDDMEETAFAGRFVEGSRGQQPLPYVWIFDRNTFFKDAWGKFCKHLETDGENGIAGVFETKDSEYEMTLSDGRMIDLNMNFTVMWHFNQNFGIGLWGKLGWTNMEYGFKGGMEGYKLSSSLYGSLGVALGLSEWVNLRFGLGLCRNTLNFKPNDKLLEHYDSVTKAHEELTKAAKKQSGFMQAMKSDFEKRGGDHASVAALLTDDTTKFTDFSLPSRPDSASNDSINLNFVTEAVFLVPISDAVWFTLSAGVDIPTHQLEFNKMGLDGTSVKIDRPVQFSFGVGLLFGL